jgi:DNA repair photolyase
MNRDKNNPFDIFEERAMISLGPLTPSKHCPYSCLFCYVPNGFLQYSSLEISDICNYLNNKDAFEIIYISGDTDSFAPPRLEKGLELLERLADEFEKDILITTRTSMDIKVIERLMKIAKVLLKKNKKLFVCISISSPDDNRKIEPLPIPTVASRINTLSLLKENGLCSILAMRPFLPIYCSDDYFKLIDSLAHSVDLILGEVWYHDLDKTMWTKLTGKSIIYKGVSCKTIMRFCGNNMEWEAWNDPQMEKDISNYCKSLNIPFFMRSSSAIEHLKLQNNPRKTIYQSSEYA